MKTINITRTITLEANCVRCTDWEPGYNGCEECDKCFEHCECSITLIEVAVATALLPVAAVLAPPVLLWWWVKDKLKAKGKP